jgi:hypothetical protein
VDIGKVKLFAAQVKKKFHGAGSPGVQGDQISFGKN